MNEQQLLAALAANPAALAQLAATLGLTTKASGVTPAVIPPHGPYSLFNTPGVDPGIVSAIVQPLFGLEGFLESRGHVRMSQDLNTLYGIMTGQTATTGDEPTDPCDEDAKIAGNLKMCYQTWVFGEFTRKTPVIRVDDAGALINRSEPLDLRLLNNPFSDLPQVLPANMSGEALFRDRQTKAVIEAMNSMRRDYCGLVYAGSPVNTASNTGGYLEYNGLDRIINTGYTNVITQVACPAADSYVASFSGAIVQNSAATVVRTMVETYRMRKYLAAQTGFTPVEFAWVMRLQAFLAITDVWPCAYATYRCTTAAPGGTSVVIDISATEQNDMRKEMRDGAYILIDGDRVPVILDDCLSEQNVGAGNFESDLYLLPIRSPVMTTTGGQVTYMEYFNYRGPYGMQETINVMGTDGNPFRVSPDGRYAMANLANTAFCIQKLLRTRKRLIVRAPFLAARLTDLRYNVYQHERSPFPGTSFFEDGGNTSFVGQTYASPI